VRSRDLIGSLRLMGLGDPTGYAQQSGQSDQTVRRAAPIQVAVLPALTTSQLKTMTVGEAERYLAQRQLSIQQAQAAQATLVAESNLRMKAALESAKQAQAAKQESAGVQSPSDWWKGFTQTPSTAPVSVFIPQVSQVKSVGVQSPSDWWKGFTQTPASYPPSVFNPQPVQVSPELIRAEVVDVPEWPTGGPVSAGAVQHVYKSTPLPEPPEKKSTAGEFLRMAWSLFSGEDVTPPEQLRNPVNSPLRIVDPTRDPSSLINQQIERENEKLRISLEQSSARRKNDMARSAEMSKLLRKQQRDQAESEARAHDASITTWINEYPEWTPPAQSFDYGPNAVDFTPLFNAFVEKGPKFVEEVQKFGQTASELSSKLTNQSMEAAGRVGASLVNPQIPEQLGVKFSEAEASQIAKAGAKGGSWTEIKSNLAFNATKIFSGKMIDKWIPNALSDADKNAVTDQAAHAVSSAVRAGKSLEEAQPIVIESMVKYVSGLLKTDQNEKRLANIMNSVTDSVSGWTPRLYSDIRGLSQIKMTQDVRDDLDRDLSDAMSTGYGKWTDSNTGRTIEKKIKDTEEARRSYAEDRNKQLQDKYKAKISAEQKPLNDLLQSSPAASSIVRNIVPLAESKMNSLSEIGRYEFVSRFGDRPMPKEQIDMIKENYGGYDAERLFDNYNKKTNNVTTASSLTNAGAYAFEKIRKAAIGYAPSGEKMKTKLENVANTLMDQKDPLIAAVMTDMLKNGTTIWRELGPLMDSTQSDQERYEMMTEKLSPLLRAMTQQAGDAAAKYLAQMSAEQRNRLLSDTALAFIQGARNATSSSQVAKGDQMRGMGDSDAGIQVDLPDVTPADTLLARSKTMNIPYDPIVRKMILAGLTLLALNAMFRGK
jgi:hypothetical protein